MTLSLQEGQKYKILGWCNAVYVGQEEIAGALQYKFRRTDGLFGIYCVTLDRLEYEVQEWQPGSNPQLERRLHLGQSLSDSFPDPGI